MDAMEIRRITKEFIDKITAEKDSEEGVGDNTEREGMLLFIRLLSELTAHSAEISLALTKGGINVDAKVREGSHGH